eukprot:m.276894 g.276894  ORF g.276894 m.276894 type:complete len:81 (+) comp15716_c0_seq2:480-722(+)
MYSLSDCALRTAKECREWEKRRSSESVIQFKAHKHAHRSKERDATFFCFCHLFKAQELLASSFLLLSPIAESCLNISCST